MTVTLDVCRITSSVAPSFPLHWPDSSFFAKPLLAWDAGAPSHACPAGSGQQALAALLTQGGPGDGDQLCPGEDPASCFAGFISPVLIIAAPGGIVPYYYTVDLCLIRHQLKPPAPSWHSCFLRAPSASACPFLYCSHRAQVIVSGPKPSSSIYTQQTWRPPGWADPSQEGRTLSAFLCWQQVLALRRLLPTATAAQRSPPRRVQPRISGA